MKIMTCFIDADAWVAIVDPKDSFHGQALEYLNYLLEMNTKLVTNNMEIDCALTRIREAQGPEMATKFMNIIDESILTIHLRMDWISRRIRRSALTDYVKYSKNDLKLRHFYLYESVKRKRVDIVFSPVQALNYFGIPIMPQAGK